MRSFWMALSAITLLLTVGGSSAHPQEKSYVDPTGYNIPPIVQKWAEKNVWKVSVGGGSGSGFFVSNDTFITACHVVNGRKNAALINGRDNRLLFMSVESCNQKSDIAVLKRTFGAFGEKFTTGRTEIVGKAPVKGTALWGPGYPLGLPLTVTQGHFSYRAGPGNTGENVYMTTLPTIMGDSGSPAVAIRDGRVVVVGVRVAIRIARYGWGKDQLITHLTLVSAGHNILEELHD